MGIDFNLLRVCLYSITILIVEVGNSFIFVLAGRGTWNGGIEITKISLFHAHN
jgi:hypothetical protein